MEQPIPKLEFEKDESYYDYCRTLMARIEQDYRHGFFFTAAACIFTFFLSIFRIRIEVFSLFATAFDVEGASPFFSTFLGGFATLIPCLITTVLAYFAWANIPKLNFVLLVLYFAMTILGVMRGSWISILLGVLGLLIYVRTLTSYSEQMRLSKLEGYPEFRETLHLSQEDIAGPPRNLKPKKPIRSFYGWEKNRNKLASEPKPQEEQEASNGKPSAVQSGQSEPE